MISRPLSATTSSTFGNFKTKKDLNINPKVSNYYSDGSGRDFYIRSNNGGFHHVGESAMPQIYVRKVSLFDHTKSSTPNPKVVIYKSNGHGRDSYISNSNGGFYKGPEASSRNYFTSNLRSYEVKGRVKNNDYLYYSQTFLNQKELELRRQLAKQQRIQSARLSTRKTGRGV